MRRVLVDFAGGDLDGLNAAQPVKAEVKANGGEVDAVTVEQLPGTATWRVAFRLTPKGDGPVDMRCYLTLYGEALTETWSYLWSPRHMSPIGQSHRLQHTARRRRALFFGLTLLSARCWPALLMLDILNANGLTLAERLALPLFFMLFTWIAGAFWTAIAGFVIRLIGRDPAVLASARCRRAAAARAHGAHHLHVQRGRAARHRGHRCHLDLAQEASPSRRSSISSSSPTRARRISPRRKRRRGRRW